MYKGLAKYYDLIYSWKDYKGEAEKVRALIAKYKQSDGNSLLEVACGTGKHLQYLRDGFQYTGLDLNDGMLKIARKRFPSTRFEKGNMINFNLGKKFDIIICLFSSIGYVKTRDNLRKTLDNFSRHLKPGGICIIEPWLTPASYKVGKAHMTVYDGNDIKIARLNVSKAKGGISILEMHHLIAEKNKKIRYIVTREELGLFDTQETLKLMEGAGLDAKFLRKNEFDRGRGILVGVRRQFPD